MSAARVSHSLPRNTRRTRLPIGSAERLSDGVPAVPWHPHCCVATPCELLTNLLTLATKTNEKQHRPFMFNGHMCCGVVKTDLVLRLTPERAAEALRQPHTRPMDFTGRPMNSMIYVNGAGTDSDEDLEVWVQSAVAVARHLPMKSPAGDRHPASSSGGTRKRASSKRAPGKK